jgi:hypothetical protein
MVVVFLAVFFYARSRSLFLRLLLATLSILPGFIAAWTYVAVRTRAFLSPLLSLWMA